MNPSNASNLDSLRIASLIPSATDICKALDLSNFVVGITHECSLDDLDDGERSSPVLILTEDKLPSTLTQGEIHRRIRENLVQQQLFSSIPSLYPIHESNFRRAAPTLVITQDLCEVCAPSSSSVNALLVDKAGGGEEALSSTQILSLTPKTLADVLENVSSVAKACGVAWRSQALRASLQSQLEQIRQCIRTALSSNNDDRSNLPVPRVLLLEWLDPPFDGGHWIPEMMAWASCEFASIPNKKSDKSSQITWKDVLEADPDVVVVACCGFDLHRNVKDTLLASGHLRTLRAAQQNRVFAVNGDLYFARPGPQLIQGVALLGLCAYDYQPQVTEALKSLDFVTDKALAEGYQKVELMTSTTKYRVEEPPPHVPDIEDFAVLHDRACVAGESFYIDLASGYHVFTEVGHKRRGKCCGSGCRHCPYNHENVVDKIAKIQQPSFLLQGESKHVIFSSSSVDDQQLPTAKVLFWSGGKDSFLTLRDLVRQACSGGDDSGGGGGGGKRSSSRFSLIVLTTFDATSREIAHQEMPLSVVVKQAEHLGLTLVGVPMHRGSSETYVARIRRALDLIETLFSVSSLVFGDLHLAHIYAWRKENMSQLGPYELEFPLFHRNYDVLVADLEASGVPCIITASTVDQVQAGEVYDEAFRKRITCDLFGENGEFHTQAQVWAVERNQALGLPKNFGQ